MDRLFLDIQAKAAPPPLQTLALNLLVALAYALTGYAGLQLAFVGQAVTLFWPPSGIAFAALWLGGLRLVPGVALGAFAVNLAALGGWPLALLVAIGNTLPALAATLALRQRIAAGPAAGELARVLAFILIAALGATTISATVGTLAVAGVAGIGSSVQATWIVWWMGDAMGVLIAAPPILLWRRIAATTPTPGFFLDSIAFAAAGLGIIAGLLLIENPIWAVELCKLFTLLLSLWAGIRFGLGGPAAMTLLMAIGAVAVTMLGAGPFVRGDFYDSFALLHSYLFAEAVAGMLLAAALADLRRTAAAEASARAQAEAASANRIRLLTMISHDVRTPLTGMAGAFDALAATALSPHQSRLVALGQRAGQTLQTLVTDILDVARADAGRITLSPAPFSLARSITDIADIHRAAAEAKGLGITVAGTGSLPACQWGDRARIEQIIGNLVVNAVTYTESGGIRIETAHTDGVTRIIVEDTGPGLPPEAAARITDAFTPEDFTLLPRAGRRSAGLGLGLHICHRLATLMGGTLAYADAPGGGSRFRFEAPLPAAAAPTPASAAAPDPAFNILLVEDDPISREVTTALLASRGHRITPATTEDEAVAIATSGQFDLVLMDLQLGQSGSGLAATRRIRAAGMDAPIIGLTADGSDASTRAAVEAGLSGLIVKPVDLGGGLQSALAASRFDPEPNLRVPLAQLLSGTNSPHPR